MDWDTVLIKSDLAVQKALQAQFIGHACANPLQSCKKESAKTFAQEHVFGDNFPSASVPVQACKHDPENKEETSKFCDM